MLVGDFLTRNAENSPDKIAIICGDRRVTYADLNEMSNRFAWALIKGGVRSGDRAAILVENSVEAAIAVFGTLKAGGVFVVINQTVKTRQISDSP